MTPQQDTPTTAVQAPPTNKGPSAMELAKEMVYEPKFLTELRNACPKSLTPERVARAVLTASLGSPNLQQCFTTPYGRRTVANAILKSAQRGLEIDGRQGHLIPFFNTKKNSYEAVFVPGYQGLIDLAYNHPNVQAIWAEAVFETDTFHYELGLNRNITHVRNDDVDNPGKLIAAYAVCKMSRGGSVFVVLRQREIKRIRACSRGSEKPDSPWNTDEESMWKKSALRALCKVIPQSSELVEALRDDEQAVDLSKLQSSNSAPATASSLLMGRAPAVLPTPDHEPAAEDAPTQPAPEPEVVQPRPRRSRARSMAEPEDNVPMGSTPAPEKTPQEVLADFVVTYLGRTFDEFVNAAIEAGQLPDSCPATGFNELPNDFCVKMNANQALIGKIFITQQ